MQTWILTLAAPMVMPDGTTQPAGTAVERIVWDGKTPYTPAAGLALVADTGQTVFVPAPPVPTTIASLAYIQRFTSAEQTALMAADPLWAVLTAAAGTIDVTNALLLTEMAAAVTAGLLTQARSTQILNLAVSSP